MKFSTLLLFYLIQVHIVTVKGWVHSPSVGLLTSRTMQSLTITTHGSTSIKLFATKQDDPPQRLFSQARTRKEKYGADSKLASLHKERIKTAGRVGTKRFVDPNKVFIGNLPFDTDKDQLASFILNEMGQTRMALHRSKIIYDWKTGKSKGYGFVEFCDPIFATVCIETCNGKKMQGRPITVSQGKKKDQENLIYLKKNKKKAESDEDLAISSALEDAESDEYEEEEMERDEDGIAIFGNNDAEDLELDAALFGIDADGDDDEEDDGIFLERPPQYEYVDPNLNREQRRKARRVKKTKLPHKGFG